MNLSEVRLVNWIGILLLLLLLVYYLYDVDDMDLMLKLSGVRSERKVLVVLL